MSVYDKGAYDCQNCGRVYPRLRSKEQLERRDWEMHCPKCSSFADITKIQTKLGYKPKIFMKKE
jgi:Zn finger protein HypA/HybF involved in hydrogenase expression